MGSEIMNGKLFLVCEKCGKKMIERQPNGLFYFIFGKKKDREGKLYEFCPVEIMIHGSVKMRCLSRECGHWNVFQYFPSEIESNSSIIHNQRKLNPNNETIIRR
jgi:hypothetical protein